MTPIPPKDIYPLNTHPVPPSGLFFFPFVGFVEMTTRFSMKILLAWVKSKHFSLYFPKGQSCFFLNFGLNGWKNILRDFYGKGASFSFPFAKGGWTTNSLGCFCMFGVVCGLLTDFFSCGLLVLYWFKQTNQCNLLRNIRFALQHIRISDTGWCRGCNTDIAHIPLGSAPLLWSDNMATSQRIVFYLWET